MKSFSLIVLLFVAAFSYSQNNQSAFTFSPDKPKVGDDISLTYNTAVANAALKNSSSVLAQVLIYRHKDSPLLIEIPLSKEGTLWKGNLTLKESEACYLLFKFKEKEKVDDNAGNVWDSYVYSADGKTVRDAHLNKGNLLMFGSFNDFAKTKDLDAAANELKLEKDSYPDNIKATFALWNIMNRGEDKVLAKANIRKELDETYAKYKTDDASTGTFVYWYNTVGDSTTAKQVRDAALAANPKGEYAQSQRVNAIMSEDDPDKRIELLSAFQKEFPDYKPSNLEGVKASIVRSYISKKQFDKAGDFLETCDFPVPNTSNTLATNLMANDQLDKAIYWIKKAIAKTDDLDLSRKPSYMNDADYRDDNNSTKTMLLGTYYKCLIKKGDIDDAFKSSEESYTLTKGDDIDANERYVDALVRTGKYDKASEVALACIKNGKSSEDVMNNFRTAYTKSKGSDKGFDDLIADARKEVIEKMRKDILATRLKDKPEIDFTLKDLNGASVNLASLKGKVVIVDFWATWCGPCKSSFPHLQKVYEKYKDNPNVQFLALNTWESDFKTYDTKLANAKKFIADNKYTFPVLIDEGQVIDKYEVDGIPTQFIIDKHGNISFKTVGYEGPQMEDQLAQQIEILLNETIGMR